MTNDNNMCRVRELFSLTKIKHEKKENTLSIVRVSTLLAFWRVFFCLGSPTPNRDGACDKRTATRTAQSPFAQCQTNQTTPNKRQEQKATTITKTARPVLPLPEAHVVM